MNEESKERLRNFLNGVNGLDKALANSRLFRQASAPADVIKATPKTERSEKKNFHWVAADSRPTKSEPLGTGGFTRSISMGSERSASGARSSSKELPGTGGFTRSISSGTAAAPGPSAQGSLLTHRSTTHECESLFSDDESNSPGQPLPDVPFADVEESSTADDLSRTSSPVRDRAWREHSHGKRYKSRTMNMTRFARGDGPPQAGPSTWEKHTAADALAFGSKEERNRRPGSKEHLSKDALAIHSLRMSCHNVGSELAEVRKLIRSLRYEHGCDEQRISERISEGRCSEVDGLDLSPEDRPQIVGA
jgi:hypothetical protein